MRLEYAAEDEAFRTELQAWLADNPPPTEEEQRGRRSSADMPDWARRWQRRLFDDGWLVPGWPPALGGRDANAVQQMIYFEEFSARDVPRSSNPQGLSIVTPSLVDHGTDEQKERWALPTLRGEIAWCLGMSEPNAGSDLASLSTRAVLDGDRFVVNGQKVWTSGAHHADWCLCFVRTNPEARKHKGISALIIDMKSPGITCRPLPELTDPDYADFNEVFFDDVEVPAGHLLGPLDGGWPITQGSLAHERAMLWITNATSLQRSVEALVELGRRDPERAADARFRDTVAHLAIDARAAMLLGYRGFTKATKGRPAPEHTLLKLFTSESERRLCLAAFEALGPEAVDRAGPVHTITREGSWGDLYLRSFSGTIAGGTSEIQRNIIAERVLGLPRS
jgi:alkylation response protein AidB-like acyl-CoA dehydrogenase